MASGPLIVSLLILNAVIIAVVAYILRSLWTRVEALEKVLVFPGGVLGRPAESDLARQLSPKDIAIIAAALAVYLDKEVEQLNISSIKRVASDYPVTLN